MTLVPTTEISTPSAPTFLFLTVPLMRKYPVSERTISLPVMDFVVGNGMISVVFSNEPPITSFLNVILTPLIPPKSSTFPNEILYTPFATSVLALERSVSCGSVLL